MLMKAYIIVTGIIFALITVAHIWRATVETRLASDPLFIVLTLACIALSIWATRLVTRSPRA